MSINKNEKDNPLSKSHRMPIVDPDVFQPKYCCNDMKVKYHSKAWCMFADLHYHSGYWKPILEAKQKGICPVCGEMLRDSHEKTSMHHLSYDMCCEGCKVKDMIKVPYCPSDDPDKVSYKMVPNCAVCKYKTPDLHAACESKLALFHRTCHARAHNKL